jgi:quercetin dioxygenase-like cupin family protein
MAIAHAHGGDIISVRPLGEKLTREVTTTLVKTPHLEVLRLVMPRGKLIRRHQVPGEVTLQCLEGRVKVDLGERKVELAAGDFLYLDGQEPHGLDALADSTLLVTILLATGRKAESLRWPSVLVEELSELSPLEG